MVGAQRKFGPRGDEVRRALGIHNLHRRHARVLDEEFLLVILPELDRAAEIGEGAIGLAGARQHQSARTVGVPRLRIEGDGVVEILARAPVGRLSRPSACPRQT